jgi:hypothetical protein
MADASSPGMLATLLPVLVGGALALAGSWLGPWLLERRKENAETRKRRAEKFEELVEAVFEFDRWIDHGRQHYVYGKDVPDAVSPFWKVHAISAAYFPQFDGAINELSLASGNYRLWMTKAGARRIGSESGKANDGFTDVYAPYAEKRDALLKALKEFAAEEFH